MTRISESEMKVMRLIWDSQRGMTGAEVQEKAEDDWAITTVLTFLTRLTEKGLLKPVKEGRSKVYYPAVTEEEYKRTQSKQFIDDMYSGSVKSFLAALYEGKKITKKEICDIKDWFEEL